MLSPKRLQLRLPKLAMTFDLRVFYAKSILWTLGGTIHLKIDVSRTLPLNPKAQFYAVIFVMPNYCKNELNGFTGISNL